MALKKNKIILNVYTDGSLRALKYGGIGYIITDGNDNLIKKHSVGYIDNTIAQLELLAVLKALMFIEKKYKSELKQVDVSIYSDSTYTVNSLNFWIYSYIKNSWKTSDKRRVKNISILKKLYDFKSKLTYILFHIKAHTNMLDIKSIRNTQADDLARNASMKIMQHHEGV